jgi:disulfide bond formation protein DsbB
MTTEHPDWCREQRIETYRAEAMVLFEANQAGRAGAVRAAILILTVLGAGVGAGINAHSSAVALALPPLTLMLLSYMFQQYADVSVTGAARDILERLIREELGTPALLYEFAVAPARRDSRLERSQRALDAALVLVVLALIGTGLAIAIEGQRWYVEVGFALSTAVSFASALMSYRDMRRAGEIARDNIEDKVITAGVKLPKRDEAGG